jgi:hypothetical protein
MAHACNPSYSRGGGRRIIIQGQPRQKLKTLYEKQTQTKRTAAMAEEAGDSEFECQSFKKKKKKDSVLM